ncbi:type IV secretory system conjugative DNA transfer family protein [Yersinia aldovae]|uniref:TraM recognition domain-containing protein n=1 Tax=Yersinia aldovae TaxID=29483 RepID=UPI0011A85DAD|nr:TraM recognition domain-containing protein [Yersinia aldovae]
MSQHEINRDIVQKDTRPLGQRIGEIFKDLNYFRGLMLTLILLQLLTPALWLLWIFVSLISIAYISDLKLKMPLRVPQDIGGIDPSEYYTLNSTFNYWLFKGTRSRRIYQAAKGILYWGNLRTDDPKQQGMENWSTNSDARTHAFLSGTTGSGKSEALYGIVHNTLCWGSGAIYADGKADISLPFTIWSLCRRTGRDDDFLHMNLLTGGRDPYVDMVSAEKARIQGKEYFTEKNGAARSNTMNPFYGGAADFQLQLLVSLLPKSDGAGSQWQEKAISLADALIRCLRYKHVRGDLTSGIEAIREYMALEELVKLYQEGLAGLLPEAAVMPITSYLKTGLSFNFSLIDNPEKWDQEIRNQHSYLTSQFGRTLSMMMDSYGFVYNVKQPEIDMTDVLLNNRILVISIPSMEKSPQEAEALGKLALACIKLMMAENLGSNYEGTIAEILKSRATASPHPYIIITDELAYYFAQGLAVMYAQARSLGFMMIAAVQDIQGLKRSSAGNETASLLANTKFKYCLALEDTEDTFNLIKLSAGEAYYSTLTGYDYNSGVTSSWSASDNSRIEQKSRLQINDVKSLNSGEGFLIFKDALIKTNAYFIPDELKLTKLKPRVNRFIEIEPPTDLSIITDKIEQVVNTIADSSSIMKRLLATEIQLPILNDPIHRALLDEEYEINYYEDPNNPDEITSLNQQKGRLYKSAINGLSFATNLSSNELFFHEVVHQQNNLSVMETDIQF